MSSSYSSLGWVLSHLVHFTVNSLDLFMFICVYFVLSFLPRDALLSAVYAVVMCLCVCVSVCHTPVLYQNG